MAHLDARRAGAPDPAKGGKEVVLVRLLSLGSIGEHAVLEVLGRDDSIDHEVPGHGVDVVHALHDLYGHLGHRLRHGKGVTRPHDPEGVAWPHRTCRDRPSIRSERALMDERGIALAGIHEVGGGQTEGCAVLCLQPIIHTVGVVVVVQPEVDLQEFTATE